MTRTSFIAGRLREVLLDGRWIANTNYKDQLEQVSFEQAVKKIGDLNTIAALTFHINYYLGGLLNVFENGKLEISDKYSFDCPEIRSAADWQKLVNEFLSNAQKFVGKVEQMQDDILDQPFIDPKYGTWIRNIEGMTEHAYYHLGQIALIRKMTEA